MDYRFFSSFCIAFMVMLNSLNAGYVSTTDSLLYLLNNNLVKDDAAKYELLCNIAFSTDDADVKLQYSEQAIKLARKLDIFPAKALLFKGEGYLNSGKLDSAIACFINAAVYYQEERNNNGLASAYIYMSEAYNQLEDYSNAKYYLRNAVDIYQQEKDSFYLAVAFLNLGYVNYCMGQYDTTLILNTTAGEIFQKVQYTLGLTYCLGNSGLAYFKMSALEKAEDNLIRAIATLNSGINDRALTEYMIGYAGVLQQMGDLKKAMAYATRSYGMAVRNGFKENTPQPVSGAFEPRLVA